MDPRDTHLGDTDSDSDSFVLVSSAPAPASPATSSPAKAGLLSSFSFALEDYLAEESAYSTARSEVEVSNGADISPEPADALDTEDAVCKPNLYVSVLICIGSYCAYASNLRRGESK